MYQKIKQKKAAIELSMTTIVVVVLSLTLLIMGFVLVRTIMCGAIGLTSGVNDKAKEQIDSLFGSSGGEIQCVASGSAVTAIPGETNFVWCGIRATDTGVKYKFEVEPDYSIANSLDRNDYQFVDSNFNEEVSPIDTDAKEIARLIIPDDAPEKDITLKVKVYKDNDLAYTKTLHYEVSRKGLVQSIMFC